MIQNDDVASSPPIDATQSAGATAPADLQSLIDQREQRRRDIEATFTNLLATRRHAAEQEGQGTLSSEQGDQLVAAATQDLAQAQAPLPWVSDPAAISPELRAEWETMESLEDSVQRAQIVSGSAAYHVEIAGWSVAERDAHQTSTSMTVEEARDLSVTTAAAVVTTKTALADWLSEKGVHAPDAGIKAQRDDRDQRPALPHSGIAKVFLGATESNERRDSVKEHPALKQAFVLDAALSKFAEQRLPQKDREAFMAHQRKSIAADLAQGRELPAVAVRVNSLQQRERQPQSER